MITKGTNLPQATGRIGAILRFIIHAFKFIGTWMTAQVWRTYIRSVISNCF
jgi:hypothetical protein